MNSVHVVMCESLNIYILMSDVKYTFTNRLFCKCSLELYVFLLELPCSLKMIYCCCFFTANSQTYYTI